MSRALLWGARGSLALRGMGGRHALTRGEGIGTKAGGGTWSGQIGLLRFSNISNV